MVKLVNDIFVRCKPLSYSPQHVVAAGKKRDLHLEFVLLCLLVKNLPLCKRQKLTGNNAQLFLPAHNRNDFRFNRRADAIYLYNYIVKDQNRGSFRMPLLCPGGQKPHPSHSCFPQESVAVNGTWFLATS